MKVIELFAGVGSQTQALKNIGVEHEVVKVVEYDKYCVSSYNQLHDANIEVADIREIEKLPTSDLWTYSFPCQDLSVAGKGAGIKVGTRSGLLFEVERILEVSEKPKYLLMENVKNLIGKKNKADFDIWCKKLEELGYKNFYQVLNAKDYRIPQNRDRVFMVSILGGGEYIFPYREELKLRLKDMLENEVDEKFYLSEEKVKLFLKQGNVNPSGKGINGNVNTKDVSDTLTTNKGEGPKILIAGKVNIANQDSLNRVYSTNGICCTLDTMQGGHRQPKILIKNATKKGYLEAENGDYVNLQFPDRKTRRGRVQKEISATLMCNDANGVVENFRIRKLTPRECWRLMGWKDEQFDKIKGISNSQLYKQAGNGIVVTVLEEIFRNLFLKEATNDNIR